MVVGSVGLVLCDGGVVDGVGGIDVAAGVGFVGAVAGALVVAALLAAGVLYGFGELVAGMGFGVAGIGCGVGVVFRCCGRGGAGRWVSDGCGGAAPVRLDGCMNWSVTPRIGSGSVGHWLGMGLGSRLNAVKAAAISVPTPIRRDVGSCGHDSRCTREVVGGVSLS